MNTKNLESLIREAYLPFLAEEYPDIFNINEILTDKYISDYIVKKAAQGKNKNCNNCDDFQELDKFLKMEVHFLYKNLLYRLQKYNFNDKKIRKSRSENILKKAMLSLLWFQKYFHKVGFDDFVSDRDGEGLRYSDIIDDEDKSIFALKDILL